MGRVQDMAVRFACRHERFAKILRLCAQEREQPLERCTDPLVVLFQHFDSRGQIYRTRKARGNACKRTRAARVGGAGNQAVVHLQALRQGSRGFVHVRLRVGEAFVNRCGELPQWHLCDGRPRLNQCVVKEHVKQNPGIAAKRRSHQGFQGIDFG